MIPDELFRNIGEEEVHDIDDPTVSMRLYR